MLPTEFEHPNPRLRKILTSFMAMVSVWGFYSVIGQSLSYFFPRTFSAQSQLLTIIQIGGSLGLTGMFRKRIESLLLLVDQEAYLSSPVSRRKSLFWSIVTFPLLIGMIFMFGLFPPSWLLIIVFVVFYPDYYRKRLEQRGDTQRRLDSFMPEFVLRTRRRGIKTKLWLTLRRSPVKVGIASMLILGGAIAELVRGNQKVE